MYIVAWANYCCTWLQLFVVWHYQTIDEADDQMLRCIKSDIWYEFDEEMGENNIQDAIHDMINWHWKWSDRVDYSSWECVDYTRPDWDIIKYLIHQV